MENIERRVFLKGAVMVALAFTVGGVEVLLTPRSLPCRCAAQSKWR